ncbi:hypothetical protein C0995_013098 [Termitomyces sp. Mi166|nr:hypothetical protein C0995_013098 [Termitomyces sp. Mi166\
MPYLPSRYPYLAEYRSRQRPSNTPYFSGAAVFTHYGTISRQRSPLLPSSKNDSTSLSWNFFDKLKNVWSWRDNGLSTSVKTVSYTPLYLPSPSEFLHPRPAPLPPSTVVDRLLSDTSRSRVPLGQNIINKPSIHARQEIFADEQPAPQVSILRHPKRSRPSLSPHHNVYEIRSREEGVRKRVRFSTEFLSSNVSGSDVYRFPSRKGLWKSRFLPFADWIAYHCNNILTEDRCNKLVMTIIDEKVVAEKLTSIFEEYFPERTSVDGLEAPTTAFLALWYLGRLFRNGIFCLSDVDAVGAPEAVIRAFLLGLTLADKWLNDGSRRLKDWGKFCSLPFRFRTSAEKRALRMLDYNISVTNLEWRDWLDRLKPSTSKFVSENFTHPTQITAKVALESLRRAKALRNTPMKGHVRPREVEISAESLYFLRLDLLEDR